MTSSDRPMPGAMGKWLSVIGIGEDGPDGLGVAARRAIEEAEFVYGGRRHLHLAASLIRGKAHAWPVPFEGAAAEIVRLRGRKVCALASGDPLHFGVGAVLARHIAAEEMQIIPAASASSLAAARLGWALQDVEIISLHGRPTELILPLLHPGRRIIALTSDGSAPAALAALIARKGFGASCLHVLEALGGPDERASLLRADAMGDVCFGPLNVVAIEVDATRNAVVLPLAAGLADELFEHDGQITKREIRAVTIAALAPRRGETLWDIGAGSGSISIAWMLAHHSMHAVAVEADATRAGRIRRNAVELGVPELQVVHGAAPLALADLPPPDAIFMGGGGSDDGVIETAIASLRAGGRLVANAVTLDTEAILLERHRKLGGELLRIALSRAMPLGTKTGWQSARPVMQWVWTKP